MVPLPNASFLREALVFHKVPIYLESTISEIKDGSVVIKGKDGTVTEVEADNVVNAIGFVPTPVAKSGPQRPPGGRLRLHRQPAHRHLARLGRLHEDLTVKLDKIPPVIAGGIFLVYHARKYVL